MAYDPNNIFAKILRGEIPCTKVLETEHSLAFRDINPQRPVHVLVIPKGAYVTWDDFATNATPAEQADFVQAVGAVARQEGVAEAGYRLIQNNGDNGHQEVPHLHVHVVGGGPTGPMLRRQD
jgi:diadenosine tetraphosphate (Ap4A) HIT family hydrolase